MTTKMFCAIRPLVLMLFAQFLFHAAAPSIAGEDVSKKDLNQAARTAPADREDSLTLGLDLTKDSDGRVWAHFYIHNRGKTPLLICDAMELSFFASTADSKDNFPLYYASDDLNPFTFFLVHGRLSGQAASGLTSVSRRVQVRRIHLTRLVGLQKVLPEKMKKAKLVGRVEGWVLKWDIAGGEYVKMPFHISSLPQPWQRFSHLFTTPVSVPIKGDLSTEMMDTQTPCARPPSFGPHDGKDCAERIDGQKNR